MKLFNLLCISFLISACGGGGSSLSDSDGGVTFSGSTAPAAINEENAENIGTAAGESVQRAATSSSFIPSAISIENNSEINISEINQLIINNAKIAHMPSGIILNGVCSSGSVSVNEPTQNSGPVTLNFVYSQCKLNGVNATATGKVRFHYNDFGNEAAGFDITYRNFRISQPGYQTITINMNISCVNESTCSYNTDFVGNDGSTHRVSSFSFTGHFSTGYNGTATFYHGQYGRVSIAASNLTYGDCGLHPDGGAISFSSTNGTSGTINFNANCTVSGTWNNGTVSGIF